MILILCVSLFTMLAGFVCPWNLRHLPLASTGVSSSLSGTSGGAWLHLRDCFFDEQRFNASAELVRLALLQLPCHGMVAV